MVATTDILQPWGEKVDPFEDAIIEAECKEGQYLIDAVEEFEDFTRENLRYHTYEDPRELTKALEVFDGLVQQAHVRFAEYISRLAAIQEEFHGHP